MSFEEERLRLIQHLHREILDQKVLDAMARIPRELFIPAGDRYLAYEDRPLSIGEGQTISQPFIVALMTQALQLTKNDKVLEVGAGSGYQTAILADLAREVISVERLQTLADTARQNLVKLGYTNTRVYLAGDVLGWPANAPYDAIMVTAAAPQIPTTLLDQLKADGRMIIPVGSIWDQDLLLVIKHEKGITVTSLTPCRFVPLIGNGAWKNDCNHAY